MSLVYLANDRTWVLPPRRRRPRHQAPPAAAAHRAPEVPPGRGPPARQYASPAAGPDELL